MAKVWFIEPQSRRWRGYNAWVERWPMLGPVMLGSVLKQKGHEAAVYNENVSGSLLDNPQVYQQVCAADMVGITMMTPTANRGYMLADRLRADSPRLRIAIGGIHASMMPQEAIQHADVVVCGEAENMIEDLAQGRVGPGIVHAQAPQDLDALPMLDYSIMVDFDKLAASNCGRHMYQLPLIASRGCPHGCTYCSVTQMFGRKVRRQSVARVMQDVEHYVRQGFRHFFFYDDNFVSDRQWACDLLDRLRGLRIRFNAQARADLAWIDADRKQLDKRLLGLIRRAGADVFYIGYETIDDLTAKQWNKGYRGKEKLRERLLEDTRILHDCGLWVHGMFVLGPGHDQRTADQIVQFARAAKIETIQISLLTPIPGTLVFEQMKPSIVLGDYPDDWDFYDGTHCVYDHPQLGIEGAQAMLLKAHKKFYRCGGWNLRRLRAVLEGPWGIADKLALLRQHIGIARQTMRQWRQDSEAFLQVVRARRAGQGGVT